MTEEYYFIISPEHTHNKDIITFWALKSCGYTMDFEKAETYTEEEIKLRSIAFYRDHLWKSWQLEDFAVTHKELDELSSLKTVRIRR